MSQTGQPNLNTELLFSEDKAMRQFVEEVRKEHGVGRVMQTEKGGLVPLRYNEKTGGMEVKQGRKWQPIGTSVAPAPAPDTQTVDSVRIIPGGGTEGNRNSGYFPHSITVVGNINVSGTVDNVDVSEIPTTYAPIASPTFTGVVSLPDGSAAVPSLTNTGDINTGLYFPAADQVGISVGGVVGLRVEGTSVTPNVVGGYSGNSITATAYSATIGGGGAVGYENTASADLATISGGSGNTVGGVSGTVVGGTSNTANGDYSTVLGGLSNYIITDADLATVGGRKAKVNDATHGGTFLYADSTDAYFYSTAANEFAVRATGGFRFVTAGTVASGDFTPTKTVTIDTAGTIDVPGVYEVDGTQVVGNQQAHIADAKEDYTTGDLDSEAEIIAAINATNAKLNDLLAALETHGLLASS